MLHIAILLLKTPVIDIDAINELEEINVDYI